MAKSNILVIDDEVDVAKVITARLKKSGQDARSASGGKEALGEATVRIIENGKIFIGRGVSTDIIEASAKAYVDAINRVETFKKNNHS